MSKRSDDAIAATMLTAFVILFAYGFYEILEFLIATVNAAGIGVTRLVVFLAILATWRLCYRWMRSGQG